MGLVNKHPVTKFAIRRLHYGERGGGLAIFWDPSFRYHFKKPLLTKQNYRKKVFFHELLVQVLRKHFRGGWGVQAHAYFAYTGGGGGPRIMENMLM